VGCCEGLILLCPVPLKIHASLGAGWFPARNYGPSDSQVQISRFSWPDLPFPLRPLEEPFFQSFLLLRNVRLPTCFVKWVVFTFSLLFARVPDPGVPPHVPKLYYFDSEVRNASSSVQPLILGVFVVKGILPPPIRLPLPWLEGSLNKAIKRPFPSPTRPSADALLSVLLFFSLTLACELASLPTTKRPLPCKLVLRNL